MIIEFVFVSSSKVDNFSNKSYSKYQQTFRTLMFDICYMYIYSG